MIGYFRQDDAGHWYIIPKEKVTRFVGLKEDMYLSDWKKRFELSQIFMEEFEQYRLSGGIENYEVEIKDE